MTLVLWMNLERKTRQEKKPELESWRYRQGHESVLATTPEVRELLLPGVKAR